MSDDELSAELRDLFRDGATVARLVRHARERLGPGSDPTAWVRAVRQAFHVGPGGWTVIWKVASFGPGGRPDADLTWAFLGLLLLHRGTWDEPADLPRWYDGLPKTEVADRHRQADVTRCGMSPAGWAALSEQDRSVVRTIEASRLALSEDVVILAALAEQLQRRLEAAEVLAAAGDVP